MVRTVFVNGEYLPETEGKISIFDRGFLFADGVYEVSAVINGKLVDYTAHMERLGRSLKFIGAQETFANDPAKIRSEQVSQNTVAGTGPEGVPGATSNTPPGPNAAAAPNPAAPVETASSATRNFEMDRTLQHTRQPAGRVRRVTAAVLVDHVPRTGENGKVVMTALDAATLTRIEALVKEAVGFDAERGDSVSVMNAPFVRETEAPVDVPFWESPWLHNPMVRDIARYGLGALVVIVLLFGVLRPAMRQIIHPAARRKVEDEDDGSTDVLLSVRNIVPGHFLKERFEGISSVTATSGSSGHMSRVTMPLAR